MVGLEKRFRCQRQETAMNKLVLPWNLTSIHQFGYQVICLKKQINHLHVRRCVFKSYMPLRHYNLQFAGI